MKRITVIHSGALGDVILAGRLIETLRRDGEAEGGRPHVKLVAGGEKARLLAGLGAVDEAVDFDSLPMGEVFSDAPPQCCRLPGLLGQCDRLISFFGGDARAQLRLAALAGAADASFLPVRPPADADCHLVELWCDMLGLEFPTAWQAWPVPPQWRSDARSALAAAGVEQCQPYALLHVGSGGRDKCWPLERYLQLASLIEAGSAGAARQAVFVIGPVELDSWPGGQLASLRRSAAVIEAPPLGLLAGLCAGSTVYVGNDSGPTHLAAAVGSPTVALFGPSSAVHFAPLGARVRVVTQCQGLTGPQVASDIAAATRL
jgi:ADP-heptose:LPS heptosyltransferase